MYDLFIKYYIQLYKLCQIKIKNVQQEISILFEIIVIKNQQVREAGDMSLEEELIAKLIFLYRSPETLIKWTRPPKIKED